MNASALMVWIVDDDAGVRWVLDKALQAAGMETRQFDHAAAFFQALQTQRPDVVISDVRMPGEDGIALIRRLAKHQAPPPVIVITAHADLDSAVAAYGGGAFEYLPKPFDVDAAVELVRRAARSATRSTTPVSSASPLPQLVGQSPAIQEVFRTIGRLSRSSINVLITGESGTGKELVARALHRHSPRSGEPFIALNTTAIASELLESELFGHERGAFTGADSRRIGRFEQAHTGTLFLDEIGDMSTALQTRLLRVLAEGEFYRVGGQTPLRVDVRIIAATNQDLMTGVARGTFREDLYHRLNVIRIETPPLRERREDIVLLLHHYLREAGREFGVETKSLAPQAQAVLCAYPWPGNVRQLVNLCRRLTVTAPATEIQLFELPPEFASGAVADAAPTAWSTSLTQWAQRHLESADAEPLLAAALPEFERTLVQVALGKVEGHRQKAARLLGWGRNTLTRKLRELGLDA